MESLVRFLQTALSVAAGWLLRLAEILRERVPYPEGFTLEAEDGHFRITDRDGESVAIISPNRSRYYKDGVSVRLDKLAAEYGMTSGFFETPKVVFDVGANVGEIGMLVERSGGDYWAFEPDPVAFSALRRNIKSENIFNFALSDSDGTVDFFLKSDSADSSLIQPKRFTQKVSIVSRTLDSMIGEVKVPERIDLFKVEAEGAEPEVIRGATELLKRVHRCSVDAGAERQGQTTAPEVLHLLLSQGFRLVMKHPTRDTFLFEKAA